MNLRDKNPVLKETILTLRKMAREKDAPVWKAVAEGLNRPKKARFEVSVSHLESQSQPKELIAVPGVVLSGGELSKALVVGACRFTWQARKKITAAGGTCLTLTELADHCPSGKGIRLLG